MSCKVNKQTAKYLVQLAEENGFDVNMDYVNSDYSGVQSAWVEDDCVLHLDNDDFEHDETYKQVKKQLSRPILNLHTEGGEFIVTKLKKGVQIGCTTIDEKSLSQVKEYVKWRNSEPSLPTNIAGKILHDDEGEGLRLGDYDKLSWDEINEVLEWVR